jgi:hypothetical protein
MDSEHPMARLANNWTVERVKACLDRAQKEELIRFIHDRYEERFLGPIRLLSRPDSSGRGFGFATMALCSLLIETIGCYRKGLPTSAHADLEDLQEGYLVSDELKKKLPKPLPGSRKIFIDFFEHEKHKRFFPDVSGEIFYTKIRCGLLHQAQTKGGWRITRSGRFWDSDALTINRDDFATRLAECFNDMLDELRATDVDKGDWPNVCVKLRWLVETS